MISEIDLLRADIPRLEQKFGAGDPFVEVLKAQLALLLNEKEATATKEAVSSLAGKFQEVSNPKENGSFHLEN